IMPRATTQRATKIRPEETRWLSTDEDAAWRALAQVLVKLPWAIECQLQRDAGLSFIEYHALARLSEDPHHTLRMSELALLPDARHAGVTSRPDPRFPLTVAAAAQKP